MVPFAPRWSGLQWKISRATSLFWALGKVFLLLILQISEGRSVTCCQARDLVSYAVCRFQVASERMRVHWWGPTWKITKRRITWGIAYTYKGGRWHSCGSFSSNQLFFSANYSSLCFLQSAAPVSQLLLMCWCVQPPSSQPGYNGKPAQMYTSFPL